MDDRQIAVGAGLDARMPSFLIAREHHSPLHAMFDRLDGKPRGGYRNERDNGRPQDEFEAAFDRENPNAKEDDEIAIVS